MARPYLKSEDHADVFRAVAHKWRRAIVDRLNVGPLTFGDLAGQLPISDATLSAHLRILREAGLITPKRRGASIAYRANLAKLRKIRRWLDAAESQSAA